MTVYTDRITAKYQTLYRDELDVILLASPPIGWRLLRVSRHRDGCPDACWRILLKKS